MGVAFRPPLKFFGGGQGWRVATPIGQEWHAIATSLYFFIFFKKKTNILFYLLIFLLVFFYCNGQTRVSFLLGVTWLTNKIC
jgi:hypothetical protein